MLGMGPKKKLEAVADFIPRFDPSDDEFQSEYMVPETIEKLYLPTTTIYSAFPSYTPDDLEYSKSLKY